MRDSTARAQLEALQFMEGETRDSTSLGEWFREMLRQDRRVNEFAERQAASRGSTALSREPSAYDLLAQRPMRRPPSSSDHATADDRRSFPPAMHAMSPPDRLGFGNRDAFGTIKPTRPLTVDSANSPLYLTSSNSISYPGRQFGRKSSFASLPTASTVHLQSPASVGKLGGPSTFTFEDPIRNSYTVRAPYPPPLPFNSFASISFGTHSSAVAPTFIVGLQLQGAQRLRSCRGSLLPNELGGVQHSADATQPAFGARGPAKR